LVTSSTISTSSTGFLSPSPKSVLEGPDQKPETIIDDYRRKFLDLLEAEYIV
jgi:hypothetical protein